MKVSVIIAHTGEEWVASCINSVKRSTYKDVQIIEVNTGQERSAQRNQGASLATGEYLLFLDADMVIHPKLIEECILYDFYALYIPEVIVGKGFWIKVRNFERQFYNGTIIDCPRFIRKDKFIPFDEDLTGVEDWDWSRRLDCKKGITKYPIYHNEGYFSFIRYLKKKRYYAQWMGKYKEKYPKCKELNVFYRYAGVFMENGKWKRLLRHPILALGMLLLRLSVGMVYLCTKKYL